MKIWDYIDLDKAENKIKENTELEIPLIAVVLTALTILAATPIAPAVAPITPAAIPITLIIAFTTLAAIPTFTKIATPASLNQ